MNYMFYAKLLKIVFSKLENSLYFKESTKQTTNQSVNFGKTNIEPKKEWNVMKLLIDQN